MFLKKNINISNVKSYAFDKFLVEFNGSKRSYSFVANK